MYIYKRERKRETSARMTTIRVQAAESMFMTAYVLATDMLLVAYGRDGRESEGEREEGGREGGEGEIR